MKLFLSLIISILYFTNVYADSLEIFNFNDKVEINKKIAKDFRKKFSYCSRLMDKMNIN